MKGRNARTVPIRSGLKKALARASIYVPPRKIKFDKSRNLERLPACAKLMVEWEPALEAPSKSRILVRGGYQIGNVRASRCFRSGQRRLDDGESICDVTSDATSDSTGVDTTPDALNNPCMPRPDAVRRVKSYSAATGHVYQYYFYEVEKSRRGNSPGTEYVYQVSTDRHMVFPVRIFVKKAALEKWSGRTGQVLTGTEEYAVAKMRLFQAFDEEEELQSKSPDLIVDESNLESLLAQLDL